MSAANPSAEELVQWLRDAMGEGDADLVQKRLAAVCRMPGGAPNTALRRVVQATTELHTASRWPAVFAPVLFEALAEESCCPSCGQLWADCEERAAGRAVDLERRVDRVLKTSPHQGKRALAGLMRYLEQDGQRDRLMRLIRRRRKVLRSDNDLWSCAGDCFCWYFQNEQAFQWMGDWRRRGVLNPGQLVGYVACLRREGRNIEAREVSQAALQWPEEDGKAYHRVWLATDAVAACDPRAAAELLARAPWKALWEYYHLVLQSSQAYVDFCLDTPRSEADAADAVAALDDLQTRFHDHFICPALQRVFSNARLSIRRSIVAQPPEAVAPAAPPQQTDQAAAHKTQGRPVAAEPVPLADEPLATADQIVREAGEALSRGDAGVFVRKLIALCLKPGEDEGPLVELVERACDTKPRQEWARHAAGALQQVMLQATRWRGGTGELWPYATLRAGFSHEDIEQFIDRRMKEGPAGRWIWLTVAYLEYLVSREPARLLDFVRRREKVLQGEHALWVHTGRALHHAELQEEALRWFADWEKRPATRAADLEPYVVSLRQVGRIEEARRVSEAALRMPHDFTTQRHLCWLAADELLAGDLDSARARLDQVPQRMANPYQQTLRNVQVLYLEFLADPERHKGPIRGRYLDRLEGIAGPNDMMAGRCQALRGLIQELRRRMKA